MIFTHYKAMILPGMLVASLAYSQAIHDLPSSLIYKKRPVDSLCFANDGQVSLTSCGIQFARDFTIIDSNEAFNKTDDAFGYRFKINNAGPTEGYSYYKRVGEIKDQQVIFTLNNGGGTGGFTAIKTILRKGNDLLIQTHQAGDRCNHGISNIKKDGNKITYDVNITPFDLLTLADDNPHHLKPYDDLVSCAVCCAGKVHSSRALNEAFNKENILSIDLTDYSLDAGGYGADKPYQACFNALIKAKRLKTKMVFTLRELKEFVREFNQKCVQ